MKEKITITKSDNSLHFYLTTDKGRAYLFTQHFSKGVYDYFRKGRSQRELYGFKQWDRNPKLNKTIEKIPIYIKYVQSELLV